MMKLPLFSIFILIFTIIGITAAAQEDADVERIDDFGSNPGNLKMFLYDPGNKKDTAMMPLVVVLHGCGQTAKEVARLTGWNKLARQYHFLVVYPQQKISNNMSGCFNWFRSADTDKGRGECESIYEQVKYVEQHYRIDTNRIFVTGVSAGAAMAVVMLATHPEKFRSGAIFAGGAYQLATNVFVSAGAMMATKPPSQEVLVDKVKEQNPGYNGKYPSMIIYQGMNDPLVNHRNAALLVEQWAGIHQCDTTADLTENGYAGVADISRKEYHNKEGETVIILYEVQHMGHRVLVDPGEGETQGGKTGTFGMDKGFYSVFQTAKEFGLTKSNN